MTSSDLKTRIDYIRNLPLAASPLKFPHIRTHGTPPLATIGDKATAGVSGSQVMSFEKDMNLENRQDVINSCLLAQLAADRYYDRHTGRDQWYNIYRNVLSMLGWTVDSWEFCRATDTETRGTVDAQVVESMEKSLSSDELKLLKRSIDSLEENDKVYELFNKKSKRLKVANFRFGVCRVIRKVGYKTVQAKMGYFSYKTHGNITDVLFANINDASVTFEQGNGIMVLNTEVYDLLRESVFKKLGDSASSFVETYDI
ncbi:hypothetical protein L218DRAFT_989830 [Marasmius fiardii PR-910]|nr:hypothetical protein L218DRAFT_989830 [Marasmius fiardii PR-910]